MTRPTPASAEPDPRCSGRPPAGGRRAVSLAVAVVALVAMMAAGGCTRTPRVVPVKGKVLYNGQPLPFGSVMFQPDRGQPAMADLTADGSFTLSSYRPNDGAVPGRHSIGVSCFEGHRPRRAGQGDSLGRLLIPLKYTRFGSSGLSAQITDSAGDQPQEVVLELTGPPASFQ